MTPIRPGEDVRLSGPPRSRGASQCTADGAAVRPRPAGVALAGRAPAASMGTWWNIRPSYTASPGRGGWTEHEPTGRAVVRCTCGLDSGIVAETQAVQIAGDHRRTAAEARVLTA